ncbi:cytochrome P450 [Actinomadura sp. KC345]|uniref:cytochrome P450 n=1 Tax=Actinomadura sp. KC345 TaxID=2530371 RepID=UPI0010529A37|nr:cytochrome P450 [Actinomadura sp. KC345]TDC57413.1 cytochrome P450 [Actinomadura sp. KC345]
MGADDVVRDGDRKKPRYHFDRHTPEYREQFEAITEEMHGKCPIAWSDTYDGHWVAAGNREVFELARAADRVSNDHDVKGVRRGYKGISIPTPERGAGSVGGFLEMDPPTQRYYRQALNPYLSPAAIDRWVPVIDELVRACLDEKIEEGRIDFVDELANIVPAVLTLGMLGIPLEDWQIYNEPVHAAVYTRPGTPEAARVAELHREMGQHLVGSFLEIQRNPRPGLIDEIARLKIDGETPPFEELLGTIGLIIGGGFDTTTALTAHALEWLGENPDERAKLSRERGAMLNSATEEFLRFYTPAVGDGRTISADCEIEGARFKEGDRLWLSWAMANRDAKVFPEPNRIDLARKNNRHSSFGIGIHRCIGSNVARTVFKRMLVQVLDRMPDYRCDPEGTVHYDTIGVINGMRHLPATFTPGERWGNGLDETLATLQRVVDEQGLAEPVTVRKTQARIG